MEYIDKTINRERAHRMIQRFIEHHWNAQAQHYIGIDFRRRSFSEHLKSKIKSLLVEEQQGLCCYCMRKLDGGEESTLEHIIPYATHTVEAMQSYLKYPVLRDNIMLQKDFEERRGRQTTPPFPHTLAYENITASCNGMFHDGIPNENSGKTCNLKRLNDAIEPLFYIRNIHWVVSYTRGGLVVSENNQYAATIHTLNLNYITLQRIRQLWFQLAKHISSDVFERMDELALTDTINQQYARQKVLVLALGGLKDLQLMKTLVEKFKTQTYWKLLMKYRWFYQYYKNIKTT